MTVEIATEPWFGLVTENINVIGCGFDEKPVGGLVLVVKHVHDRGVEPVPPEPNSTDLAAPLITLVFLFPTMWGSSAAIHGVSVAILL